MIRISGDDAFAVADRIVELKSGERICDLPGYTVRYGHVVHHGKVLDEALFLILRRPASYTAEDTVEIHTHGSRLSMRETLAAAVDAGARPAMPGEFTKRAFLNGRLDLSQAEAVMDLINAQNEYALSASVEQLSGGLSRRIREVRAGMLNHLARIEAALDDPENYTLDGYAEELSEYLKETKAELNQLARSFQEGKILKEGIRTVILGKPNVGKSSLMNLLVGEQKAIVTDIAGTTRDVLEEQILLGGLGLRLIDTAGIRDAEDVVEKAGVERAMEAAKKADLILFVVDASLPLDENDEEILRMIRGRKALVLLNKSDLPPVVTKEDLQTRTGERILSISALREEGMDQVAEAVRDMFDLGEVNYNDQVVITNIRHKKALEEAAASLELVENAVRDGLPEDFYTIDLTAAYEALGEILGESLEEDIINEIFDRFCMGK